MIPWPDTASPRSPKPPHWWEAVRTFWPVIAMFAAGLVGYGMLQSDVAQLKDGQVAAKQDHDAIVRIEAKQERMQTDVETIQRDVRAIAEAVRPR